jgi:hypothetical protein
MATLYPVEPYRTRKQRRADDRRAGKRSRWSR